MKNKILHYRKKLKISQIEVAKALGIDRNTYARRERGELNANNKIFLLAMECLVLKEKDVGR